MANKFKKGDRVQYGDLVGTITENKSVLFAVGRAVYPERLPRINFKLAWPVEFDDDGEGFVFEDDLDSLEK